MPSTSAVIPQPAKPVQDWFATTHWSVVISAGAQASPGAPEAIEKLCRIYWRPVFHFARRQGYSPHDAQDITQSFFAKLLEKNFWARADRQKGRFRTFLLNALTQFMSDQRDHARAAKRGGGMPLISLDDITLEEKIPVVHELSPEQLFDKSWATTILDQARSSLRAECAAAGKTELFESLEIVGRTGANSLTYAQLAARLNMSTGAAKTAVSRLRDRYAQLVENEIAQTLADPSQLSDEIDYLRSILSA